MTESIIKESGLLETLVSSAAQSLQTQIKELTPLVENLLQIKDFREKITLLNALPRVKSFFQKRPSFEALVREFSSLEEYLLKALIVIQQGERCTHRKPQSSYILLQS